MAMHMCPIFPLCLFAFFFQLVSSSLPNSWLTDFAVFSLPSFSTFTLIDCVPIAHTGCVVLTRFFRAFVIYKNIVIKTCFQIWDTLFLLLHFHFKSELHSTKVAYFNFNISIDLNIVSFFRSVHVHFNFIYMSLNLKYIIFRKIKNIYIWYFYIISNRI